MARPPNLHLLFVLLHLIILLHSSSAVDFLFNGFDPSNLTLHGNATLESRILILTNETTYSIGRSFYKTKIPTKSPNYPFSPLPFSTSFIFSITPSRNALSGHGIAFLFAPYPGTNGTSDAANLGLFNISNNGKPQSHVFAVEFDVFQNPEFQDIDANHIGVDLNSLTSAYSHTAGFWPSDADPNSNDSFVEQKLNNGVNYQVWIDYSDFRLNVTMARAGAERPNRPLLSVSVNLSDVFLDEMYVGFVAATGALVETHRILAWSFSNSNFSFYQGLITSNLPSFFRKSDSVYRSKGFIAGISVASVVFLSSFASVYLICARRRRKRRDEEMDAIEEWELEYWPHRIRYQEISAATNGFSEENVIGLGGNGKVYKGVLGSGAIEIAVKRIPQESDQGMKEFLAEVSSLGRLKHRNLVGLIGWCKREKAGLMLIYEYMENGSLDKRLFDCGEDQLLGWDTRVRVLKDVANGVLYLHEGWEVMVLHRDIKASNVMLDKDMNGRLGDFGLARMHGHGKALGTTRVVGTVGYMAPEVVRSGKASAKTDMFGFGVLILEVVCGRRPVEDGKEPLTEWVWGLLEKGELVMALDPHVRAKGGLDEDEVERVLQVGLLCVHPDPSVRPSMRKALKMLEGSSASEVESSEGESMDMCLLNNKVEKGLSLFRKYQRWSDKRSHPTFEDVRQSLSSSMSLSSSDIIVDGR